MATFLDVSLLNFFQPIFIFLIVFAITYGILEKSKMFGEGKSALNLIIAVCLACLTVVVNKVTTALGSILPWIIFIVIIAMMIFMIYGFFGIEEKRVWRMIGYTPILIILVVIVFIVLATTFESFLSPYNKGSVASDQVLNVTQVVNGTATTTTPTAETMKAVTNPKIVGALLILFITAASAKLLVDKLKAEP